MKEMLKKRLTMNYRTIILSFTLLAAGRGLLAQGNSETRNYIKTLPVTRETRLEILNKYGTIQITNWNKDSVMIRAEVKATATNHEKLGKMFDGVKIDMSESKYLISARTSFSQNIGMLFENFKGMTSKLINYDSRIEINYYVKVPEYLNMKVENKYGDVYMENNTGELTLSVSNGSLRASSTGQNSTLTLTFCDATIGNMGSGRIDASFSEINLDETGNITINSISSKYEIKKAGNLNIESRRDKFHINNLSTLKGTSYFTDFNFETLRKEITLSARYGRMDIEEIVSGFDAVNLNTGYTDIFLKFEQGASYNIDIRHLNSFVVISDKNAKTEKKVLNEDKKEYITSGTVGRNPGNSIVNIDATHGDIYLK